MVGERSTEGEASSVDWLIVDRPPSTRYRRYRLGDLRSPLTGCYKHRHCYASCRLPPILSSPYVASCFCLTILNFNMQVANDNKANLANSLHSNDKLDYLKGVFMTMQFGLVGSSRVKYTSEQVESGEISVDEYLASFQDHKMEFGRSIRVLVIGADGHQSMAEMASFDDARELIKYITKPIKVSENGDVVVWNKSLRMYEDAAGNKFESSEVVKVPTSSRLKLYSLILFTDKTYIEYRSIGFGLKEEIKRPYLSKILFTKMFDNDNEVVTLDQEVATEAITKATTKPTEKDVVLKFESNRL